MVCDKELREDLETIRDRLQSQDLILRHEEGKSVLYGKTSGKYRLFELTINSLTAFLFELLRKGVDPEEIALELLRNGQNEGQVKRSVEKLVSIANYNLSDASAIQYESTDTDYRSPVIATWDITNVCNLKCSHCYNESAPMRDDSMPLETCLSVVDQLADMGVHTIWVGGGEPLVKPGIDKILRKMKSRNLRVILATNGLLLKRPVMLQLVGETCDEVNLSLDGATDDDHSFLRGEGAKLKDVVQVIGLLKGAYGQRVYATALTVVHEQNLEKLPGVIDFVYELGFDKWTHDELYRQGRGREENQLVLTHEGYDRLNEIVLQKAEEYEGRMHVETQVRMHTPVPGGCATPFYGCTAGNQELAIQHDGSVYPCQKLQYRKYYCGNVRETSLEKIWLDHPIMRWLRNRDVEQTECAGCSIFSRGACNGGCLAEKEIVFGRHDTRDPMCPENRGMYHAVLKEGAEYPFIRKESQEVVPSLSLPILGQA